MLEWLRRVACCPPRPVRRRFGPPLATHTGYSQLARNWGAPRAVRLFAKVTVRPCNADQFALFEQAMHEAPGIVSAHRLAGCGHYLLEIERNEPLRLEDVKHQLMARLPGSVNCQIAVVAHTAVARDAFTQAAIGAA